MAKKSDQKVNKYLPKRHSSRKNSGYWKIQRQKTDKNIRVRLEKHIAKHPKDKVAKVALNERQNIY